MMPLPSLAQQLIEEVKSEAATTRKFLELVTDENWKWRPDLKSSEFGPLASHLADLLSWADDVLTTPEMRIALADFKAWEANSAAELVPRLDERVASVCNLLERVEDEALAETWNLYADDNLVLTMPRYRAIRIMVMNHIVHHRAQLGVYLRLQGIPVPQTYGPSADEQ